jgi:titin
VITKRWLPVVLQGLALVLVVGLALCGPAPARADLLADGAGTMNVAGGPVVASSPGHTLTFTYTADSAGITAGSIEIAVPSGWTAAQTTDSSSPGYVSTDALLANVTTGSDGSITVSNLTLLAGQQFDVTYSDAAAPSVGGLATFATSEADGSDAPAALASSPSLQVLAADGSGTMVASPSSVPAASTQSLAFTYTADPGGIQDGTVDLTVPSGWTPPQITGSSSAGYVNAGLGASDALLDQAGTVSIPSPGMIQLTGVTLAAGDTLLIGYGDATAPAAATYTFTTDESSSGGTPAAIAAPPQVTVTPVVAPGAPSLTSATPGNGQVQLAWSPPSDDGGGTITDYVINEYQGSGATGSPTRIDVGSANLSKTISGLTNGQEYTFTVQAVNSAGDGGASNSMSATLVTVPGAPSLSSATPANGQVQLSWSAPNDGGAPVQHYVIYEWVGTDTSGPPSSVIETTDASTSYTVGQLTNGRSYSFAVAAVNSVGTGSASSSLSAIPVTEPAAPTLTSATPGNGQVVLSWSAPADDGGSPVTDYVIYEYPGSNTAATATPVDTHSAGTTATVTGLENGESYTFTIEAVNSVGNGPASGSLSATPVSVPGAPAAGSATAGNGQVQISWSAPSTNGGLPITGYVINEYVGRSTSGTLKTIATGSTATSDTIAGLTNGQPYTFTVQAINSVGKSLASSSLSATPATVPGVPSLDPATPGDSQVQLSWSAPPDGGAPITGYVINEYLGGSVSGTPTTTTTASPTTSDTITGLANGQQYTFTVQAINVAGPGSPAQSVTATPRTVPDAPVLTATPGGGEVTLSWTAPTDGGAAIDHYVIDQFAGSSATGTPTTITTASTSQTVTGLANGTAYTFAVQAVNAAGPGQASAPETATPATVPTAPNLIATVAGPKLVEVVWTPPTSTGGAAISAYEVFRSTTAGSKGTQIATQAPTSATNTYIDQAVTNGTIYYYEVVAVNRAGASAASGQFSAEPQSFLPSPLLLKTFTVSGHQVTFSSPNQCIRAGKVSGKITISSTKSSRTKVRIGKAVFQVAKLVKKTITRRSASSAPIQVTLHAKHMVTQHVYTFVAQPSIVVGSGRPHTHTLRLKVTAC